MLSLNDREWKDFRTSDIFETTNIAKSKDFKKLKNGNTVFVGRQEWNNGIQGYADTEISEEKNCITISMVATTMKAFWQQYDFATSQNILVLRNKKYNKYNAIFISSVFNEYLLKKYGYGNPVKISTFPKEKILLSVNEQGLLDYDFMESYAKEQEEQKSKNILTTQKKKPQKLNIKKFLHFMKRIGKKFLYQIYVVLNQEKIFMILKE